MTDIQLCLLYVRFATYTLLVCCARLITPLVEAQPDADIQLRHICFALLLSVSSSLCNVYAVALLRAADHPSGRDSTRCCYTAALYFYCWTCCDIYTFALRLVPDYRSGQHRSVVLKGFLRVQFSDRGGRVAAPVCFHFAVRPAAHDRYTTVSVVHSLRNVCAFALLRAADHPLVEAQRDVHIQLRHICFSLAVRG